MEMLLDTHILAWFLTEDEKMSSKAWKLIQDENSRIFFSPVSTSAFVF